MSRLSFSTRSTFAVALLLVGFTALGQPRPPRQLDFASWNVNPGTLGRVIQPNGALGGGVAPEQRIADFLAAARRHHLHFVAIQEVPHGLFTTSNMSPAQRARNNDRMDVVTNAAAANGYNILSLRDEYPNNGRASMSSTRTGYILAYDPNVMNPFTPNPQRQFEAPTANGQMFYADPNSFVIGIQQARPPVLTHFHVTHAPGQTSDLTVVNWHNEANTYSTALVTQYEHYVGNVLETQRQQSTEQWISLADMNARDHTAEIQSFEASYHTLAHQNAIDYIAASVVVIDILNNIQGFLTGFLSDHDPVFGRCNMP